MCSSMVIRSAVIAACSLLIVLLLAVAVRSPGNTSASHAGGMSAMSVDMDPTGNTATVLGTRDQCAVVSPGGSVTIDVTATEIPATNPMIAFAFTLYSNPAVVSVDSFDPAFLLAASTGSSLFDAGNTTPDTDGEFVAAVVDISDSSIVPPESGSGVLARLTLGINPVATPGLYQLSISEAAHIDPANESRMPDALDAGFLAVSSTCDNLPTPTPTPVPTPTPTPTLPPTPTPPATPTPPPPTPSPTPGPSPSPGPTPVPGAPQFNPDGMFCIEVMETATECDGDMSPGASADIRQRLCIGWSPNCGTANQATKDSNFSSLVSYLPVDFTVPSALDIPLGAIVGTIRAQASLGLLNNPCNNRIQVSFTLLNARADTGDVIETMAPGLGDPMLPLALDLNGNGLPDGADRYPSFLNALFDAAEPRARLFGVTHIQGAWVTVNFLVFEPGATVTLPATGPLAFDAALGYPVVILLQDPLGTPSPGVITDFCAPFDANLVTLGATINNPCTPNYVAGANCPGPSPIPDVRELGYPSLPCDSRSRADEDGDGAINDGCPQVGATAESGAQCDNSTSDDSEDSDVNDGCPPVGEVSEGSRIPGSCTGGDEGGCLFRANPPAAGITEPVVFAISQRDADGDGIENQLDACPLISNGDWNPRSIDPVNDPDNDGLPSVCDPSPGSTGPGSPAGCRSGYTGSDEDQDCFANRSDNCPTDTQLVDPNAPPDFDNNLPNMLDTDADGIGNACDPDPLLPNGLTTSLCLTFSVEIGGPGGPTYPSKEPGPACAGEQIVPASIVGIDHDGPPADINTGPASVGFFSEVGVSVVAQAPPEGLGAWTVDVQYDPAVLEAVDCVVPAGSACNPAFSTNRVRIAGSSAAGVTGTASLGDLTFRAVTLQAVCSTLHTQVITLADPLVNPVSSVSYNGQICVGGGGECIPPANDDFDTPEVAGALPFFWVQGTNCATSAPDDPDCFGSGRTVWFAFTADRDGQVRAETPGASFDPTLSAYSGVRSALTQLACEREAFGRTSIRFPVQTGQTYYLMVGSEGETAGGILPLQVDYALEAEILINPRGTVNVRDGTASVGGTVSCSVPAGVFIVGLLRQRAGRAWVEAEFAADLLCEGFAEWRATADPVDERFAGGPAELTIQAFVYNGTDLLEFEISQDIRLGGTRPPALARCPRDGNRGFELGTPGSNSIPCWTVADLGSGSWCIQAGAIGPDGDCFGPSADVEPPPEGAQAAMSSQDGPGANILYQCGSLRSGAISFQLYINNLAEEFVTGPTLDPFGLSENQQVRVDLVSAAAMSADPFTVAAADVLLNLYQSQPGDPPVSGYSLVSADVSAYVGQDVCLRFASVDNLYYLLVGVDDVRIDMRISR